MSNNLFMTYLYNIFIFRNMVLLKNRFIDTTAPNLSWKKLFVKFRGLYCFYICVRKTLQSNLVHQESELNSIAKSHVSYSEEHETNQILTTQTGYLLQRVFESIQR